MPSLRHGQAEHLGAIPGVSADYRLDELGVQHQPSHGPGQFGLGTALAELVLDQQARQVAGRGSAFARLQAHLLQPFQAVQNGTLGRFVIQVSDDAAGCQCFNFVGNEDAITELEAPVPGQDIQNQIFKRCFFYSIG